MLAALPITLLVTVLAAILLEAGSYLIAIWGETQLEHIRVLSRAWDAAHPWLIFLLASGLALPCAGYLGCKFFRLAFSAENERPAD